MVPSTVSVGESGTIGSSIYFHDSTEAVQDAQEVDTFTVQANNPETLLFCTNAQISDVTAQGTADGLENGTESDCYAIDANGDAKLIKITVYASGGQITFR